MKNTLAVLAGITLFLALLSQTALSAVCGNSQCEEGENACSCPSDCGSCSGDVPGRACAAYYCTTEDICAIEVIPNCCGNDACEESGSYSESFGNCPADCEPREVNLSIISPVEGFRARYGGETLYKVRADADGRSIAGIPVNVEGPFETFKLFNDGLHEDGAFSDNILAARQKIRGGAEPGFYEVRFFTTFRNVDGNSTVQIEVYPYIDVALDSPGEAELGSVISAEGTLSIEGKPVRARVEGILEHESGETIAAHSFESSEQGEFSFGYRSTFLDMPGKWILRLSGEDSHGNTFDENRTIRVVEPGEIPEREIRLSKSLKQSYSPGENIEVVARVTENGSGLEDAVVFAELNENRTGLAQIGTGEYAGSLRVASVESAEAEVVVRVFNEEGGILAEKRFPVKLDPGELSFEILQPREKLLEQGQRVEFKIVVADSTGKLVSGLEPFVVFNDKKIILKEQNTGVYSAHYTIREEDFGETGALFFAESDNGAKGEKAASFFVTETTLLTDAGQKSREIFFVLALALAIGVSLYAYYARARAKTRKAGRLRELEELEKTAQKKYFREKTIDKKEYNELMEKYSKEKREMG